MTTAPRVSVVVPTYNRPALLRIALDSIRAQSLPPHELIVVDDGSTDETATRKAAADGGARLVRQDQGGKSAAVNNGLHYATGDYVWIFDDDDVAVPDAIERFVEPLERDAGLGFSFSHYWYTPGLPDGTLASPKKVSRIPDVSTLGFLPALLEFNFLSGASVFARRQCYTVAGGYDVALIRSQDYEMAIRLARTFRGEQVRGGPTFHLRVHAGTRGSAADRFDAAAKRRKWLEYDQRIFRRLYDELPLDEYAPPDVDVDRRRRRALLGRAVAMAKRQLIERALADITEAALGDDQSPLTADERRLAREGLGRGSYYSEGWRSDRAAAVELKRLALRSPVARALRIEILAALKAERTSALRQAIAAIGQVHVGEVRRRVAEAVRLTQELVAS